MQPQRFFGITEITTMTSHKKHLLQDIKIEVTHRCDLNCVHCSSDSRPSNPLVMDKVDCLRIITEAADMQVHELTFSGGEPFLWPHLHDAVREAILHKMNISIYTTGNPSDFEKQASEFKKMGIRRLIFSIFGANPRLHELVTRKRGSFDRTIEAIRYANSKKIETQLHFVPTSKNYSSIDSIVELAENLNVTTVSILRLVPQGRASLLPQDVLSKSQNVDLRNRIHRLRAKTESTGLKIRTGSPYNFLLLNEEVECHAASSRIVIGPDLHVFPCDAFKGILADEIVNTEQYSVLSKCSLKQCWKQSPYLKAVREAVCAEYHDQCQRCDNLKRCKSGCLAQKTIQDRRLTSRPDPDCIMGRQ